MEIKAEIKKPVSNAAGLVVNPGEDAEKVKREWEDKQKKK